MSAGFSLLHVVVDLNLHKQTNLQIYLHKVVDKRKKIEKNKHPKRPKSPIMEHLSLICSRLLKRFVTVNSRGTVAVVE